MTKIQLSVQESLVLARDQAYWDGVVAGVQLAADHAKDLALRKVIDAQKPAPPPAQPEAPTTPEV